MKDTLFHVSWPTAAIQIGVWRVGGLAKAVHDGSVVQVVGVQGDEGDKHDRACKDEDLAQQGASNALLYNSLSLGTSSWKLTLFEFKWSAPGWRAFAADVRLLEEAAPALVFDRHQWETFSAQCGIK